MTRTGIHTHTWQRGKTPHSSLVYTPPPPGVRPHRQDPPQLLRPSSNHTSAVRLTSSRTAGAHTLGAAATAASKPGAAMGTTAQGASSSRGTCHPPSATARYPTEHHRPDTRTHALPCASVKVHLTRHVPPWPPPAPEPTTPAQLIHQTSGPPSPLGQHLTTALALANAAQVPPPGPTYPVAGTRAGPSGRVSNSHESPRASPLADDGLRSDIHW